MKIEQLQSLDCLTPRAIGLCLRRVGSAISNFGWERAFVVRLRLPDRYQSDLWPFQGLGPALWLLKRKTKRRASAIGRVRVECFSKISRVSSSKDNDSKHTNTEAGKRLEVRLDAKR